MSARLPTVREPYRGPFGLPEAAHLFRRAGFGASHRELERAVQSGLDATLEALFREDEGEDAGSSLRSADTLTELNQLTPIQALWLQRMRTTQAPAAEKLALFWHGYFATSYEKVQNARLMWNQYLLFRRRGMGSFAELLLEVSKDPAMLLWLDGNSNRRGRPNENFAREVMELFSLGVGHYTEHDIQEAARAFSGWHVRRGDFWVNERAHDSGEKEVFGRRGHFDGADLVQLCVQQDTCATFLADRLLRFYGVPQPDSSVTGDLAQVLRECDLVMGTALRHLCSSAWFFSQPVQRALIKSPVELCIGTLRAVHGRCNHSRLAESLVRMGQSLFAPPSVKGWEGDRVWINSHRLLERARFAAAVGHGGSALGVEVEWDRVWSGADTDTPEELLDTAARRIHHEPIADPARQELLTFAQESDTGRDQALRGLTHLLLTMPEYQLQ